MVEQNGKRQSPPRINLAVESWVGSLFVTLWESLFKVTNQSQCPLWHRINTYRSTFLFEGTLFAWVYRETTRKTQAILASSLKKRDTPIFIHFVRIYVIFPLLALKGIYHYWNVCCFFQGAEANGGRGVPFSRGKKEETSPVPVGLLSALWVEGCPCELLCFCASVLWHPRFCSPPRINQ